MLKFKVSLFEKKSVIEEKEKSVIGEKSFEEKFKNVYRKNVEPYKHHSFNLPLKLPIFQQKDEIVLIQKAIDRERSNQLKTITQSVIGCFSKEIVEGMLLNFKLNYFLGDSVTQTHVIQAQLDLIIYSADVAVVNELKTYKDDHSKQALQGFSDALYPHRASISIITPLVKEPLNQEYSNPEKYYLNLKEFCADAIGCQGHPRETEILYCVLNENFGKNPETQRENPEPQKSNQRQDHSGPSSSGVQTQPTLLDNNNNRFGDSRIFSAKYYYYDNAAFDGNESVREQSKSCVG